MLVSFSDTHMTDGTFGETVSQEAFDLFADQIAELARKRRATEVRLVLLGDGLDLLRSNLWLQHPPKVRPWEPAGRAQEELVLKIVQNTLRHNRQALRHLADLPRRVAARTRLPREAICLEYVLGNHHWLLNRYSSVRKPITGAFDLHSRYVPNGFPLEVGEELADHPLRCEALRRLMEIDNVRPYASICSWVHEAIRQLGHDDGAVADAARTAIGRCALRFMKDAGLRRLLIWSPQGNN